MSELNDPRVLFAAERTLLAWVRTVSGLLAMGFLIDRTSMMLPGSPDRFGVWIGLAFILAGVALSGMSIAQYRRSVAELRPVEIPAHYWVALAPATALLVGILGVVLSVYLLLAR